METVWNQLRSSGLRITPLKKEVVSLFMHGACGLSARDVQDSLQGSHHISSVHRCLTSLEEAGFLRPDRSTEGVMRYRCSRSYYPDHAHFKCSGCGKRFPVKLDLSVDFFHRMEGTDNFRITGADIFLEGKCRSCIERKNYDDP